MYSENDSSIYIVSVLGARLKRIRLNLDMTKPKWQIKHGSVVERF
jgi:hypothetical protein